MMAPFYEYSTKFCDQIKRSECYLKLVMGEESLQSFVSEGFSDRKHNFEGFADFCKPRNLTFGALVFTQSLVRFR